MIRNGEQLSESDATRRFYCYTRYDSLGRITEVGQIRDTANVSQISNTFTRSQASLTAWFTALNLYRGQVTKTIYDQEYAGFTGFNNRLVVQQKNLRNRVSYTSYTDSPLVSTAYNNATFYTYDIHGNVDTPLQDYGQSTVYLNIMNKNGNRFKKVVYQYDLICGKVNQVSDQPGWADQFYHKYSYDAENRLTVAFQIGVLYADLCLGIWRAVTRKDSDLIIESLQYIQGVGNNEARGELSPAGLNALRKST